MATAFTATQLQRVLAAAGQRRRSLGLPDAHTDVYRLLHGAADGVEGLFVDVYGRYLVAERYAERQDEEEGLILDALAELPYEGVYFKRRPRQANVVGERELAERTPSHALRGRDAPAPWIVRENGVPYEVQLGDGLSTGLFIDQRDNRAELRRRASGKRVLNLFAYTCSFGLVAALGGAVETVNVDIAKRALERGKADYLRAGLDPTAHRFWARDVFEVLRRGHKRGERFELVVIDPPSYAKSGRSRFRVDRQLGELVEMALGVTAPGGTLLVCCNHRQMPVGKFRAHLERGLGAAGRQVVRWELRAPPGDFPTPPGMPPHLKSAWLPLSDGSRGV